LHNLLSDFQVLGLALVGSIGFLLHCIFIIILTSLNKPVLIFSFVGLIVTEIMPSLYILITQSRITQARKSIKTETSQSATATASMSSSTASSSTTGASSTGSSTTTGEEMEDL
jgi:hypothetical protein